MFPVNSQLVSHAAVVLCTNQSIVYWLTMIMATLRQPYHPIICMHVCNVYITMYYVSTIICTEYQLKALYYNIGYSVMCIGN